MDAVEIDIFLTPVVPEFPSWIKPILSKEKSEAIV